MKDSVQIGWLKERPETLLQPFLLLASFPNFLNPLIHFHGDRRDLFWGILYDRYPALFILVAPEEPAGSRVQDFPESHEPALRLQPELFWDKQTIRSPRWWIL